MAIFSTHLLNSIDGTHASDVEIVIYKVNNNLNYRKKIVKVIMK